jgi:hypothetical protein
MQVATLLTERLVTNTTLISSFAVIRQDGNAG